MSEIEAPFPTVLDPVQVPEDSFPIEVVQFWRGEYARDHPFPLHWTIVVRTSPLRGNTHEIVGDTGTYATQDRFDVPLQSLEGDNDWRGSHVVGYVARTRLDALMNHVALVPVLRHRHGWNCQNWVWEVLGGLKGEGMYVDGGMTFETLQMQMRCLLDAWETGDI